MPRQLGAGGTLPRLAVLTLLLCAGTVSIVFGQATESAMENPPRSAAQFTPNRSFHPENRKHAPPPLPVQYFYLLRLQLHLDQEADKREQRGAEREAKEVRSHMQEQLHFSAAQAGIMRQVATEYDEDCRAINAEVAPIAKADRDWVKVNGKAAGLPPNRDRVRELGQQRKAALENAIANLNSRLGPKGAARVQTYLARIFAPHDSAAGIKHPFPLRPNPTLHGPSGVSSTGSLHGEGNQ